jgi:hypothetical protein
MPETLDTAALRDAYRELLAAAVTVAGSGDPSPPAGEWTADQILAHVSILTADTIGAVVTVASGAHPTYDNRLSADAWTLERVIALAGGGAGLRERIGVQADALCALGGSSLSEAELGTLVPTRLVSNGAVLLDQPVPLKELITGLATAELPGHTAQLLALLPNGTAAQPA